VLATDRFKAAREEVRKGSLKVDDLGRDLKDAGEAYLETRNGEVAFHDRVGATVTVDAKDVHSTDILTTAIRARTLAEHYRKFEGVTEVIPQRATAFHGRNEVEVLEKVHDFFNDLNIDSDVIERIEPAMPLKGDTREAHGCTWIVYWVW
jgi:hypothetical protein